MKRMLAFLFVVGILLLYSAGALADPKAVPGTGDTFTPIEQSVYIIL